jgi:hypothetical protein
VLALDQIALEQLLETGRHECKTQTLFVLFRKVGAELYGDCHSAGKLGEVRELQQSQFMDVFD